MTVVNLTEPEIEQIPGGSPELPEGRSRRRGGIQAWVVVARLLVLLGLIACWQLAYSLDLIQHTVLPSPRSVVDALRETTANGTLIPNVAATLSATFVSVAISSLLGVTLGVSLALLPRTEQVLSFFLDALNCTPRIALAPVFVVLFGIGQTPKIVLAVTVALFVVLASARAGVHAADDDWLRLFTAMGATKRQIFAKVLLPAAIPSIASGVRLAVIWSLLGVVAMELIAAEKGAGTMIAQYSSTFQMNIVFAVILVLIVVASLINALARWIELRLLSWQPPNAR